MREGWLERSLRSARAEVAAWPEWKRKAMRVLPEPEGETTMQDDKLARMSEHANGCCRDGACDASTCMDLPKGEACGTCVHARRCTIMFGAELSDTSCGWFPRRFRRAEVPTMQDDKLNAIDRTLRTIAEALEADPAVKEGW